MDFFGIFTAEEPEKMVLMASSNVEGFEVGNHAKTADASVKSYT